MKSGWVHGLSEDEKVKLAKDLKYAEGALARLDKILALKEEDSRKPFNPDKIDGGWPYLAADANGYARAINEIRNLIK